MKDDKSMATNQRPMPLPYVAQGPDFTPGRMTFGEDEQVCKLSSNESALGPGPKAIEAMRACVGGQHLYPDADGMPLAEAIGAVHGLDPVRVLVGPGSDSILGWIIRGWAGVGDEVVYSAHGFQAYRIRAATAGVVPVSAPEREMMTDIEALLDAVTERTRIVFVANPNNPTGTFIRPAVLADLRARLRANVLLVVDEAYNEFVTDPDFESAIGMVDNGADNVIVTRTFSKFYALAGLRVGWAYAPASAMGPLSRLRGPFSVSGIAMAAAVAALDDAEHARATLAHNERWRPWLIDRIRELGFEATDSVGNFVLMKIPGGPDAAAAFDQALRGRGFVGRLADQNALPDWLRLTIGTENCMEGLASALGDLSKTYCAE